MGFVFQDFRLLSGRTAMENVAFAREVTGTRRRELAPRANRLLAQVGLSALVTHNLHQALIRIEESVEVVAYLRDGTTSQEVDAVESSLLGREGVRDVRFASRDEALLRAREDLPDFHDLFGTLEVNPLPASLEVELHPGYRTPDAVERVADAAAAFPSVEDVAYGHDWVDRLFLLRRIGAVSTAALGGAFALVAALIIGTAVRIAIFARRREIHVMRLVGATNGFIRRPFLLEGFITGLAGGGLALGLTYAPHVAVHRLIFPLEWIPLKWAGAGVAAGAFLGVLASAFAVRRHLQEV